MQPTVHRRGWTELLLTPVVVTMILSLLGGSATRTRFGQTGIDAMIAALALLLAVVYGTLLPKLRRMAQADGLGRLRLGFTAAGQRFFLTLAAAGAIAWKWPAGREVFLVWIAAGYVVLSLAETVALVRWMKRTESKACS